jgi:hypothetical protein
MLGVLFLMLSFAKKAPEHKSGIIFSFSLAKATLEHERKVIFSAFTCQNDPGGQEWCIFFGFKSLFSSCQQGIPVVLPSRDQKMLGLQ